MDLYEKFKSSQQAQVQLEIALAQWFLPEDKHRAEYEVYLHKRARSAAQRLIELDDGETLVTPQVSSGATMKTRPSFSYSMAFSTWAL